MNPWNGVNASIPPGSGEAMGGLYGFAPPLPRCPKSKTSLYPSIWRFPSSSGHTPPVVVPHPTDPALCWSRSWSQLIDQPQDFLEQFSRHRDLGHLEDGVAGVAHDLGADLDQLVPQAGQRLLRDRLGQCQRPHEVGEVVGQRVQLKTHRVGGERAT